MFEEDIVIQDSQSVEAALQFQKEEEIKEEVKKFSKLIMQQNFEKKNLSSIKFWQDKKIEFPHLATLFIILNSINASSAFIERFFSICGIIATQRNQNSNEDLFYDRAMLCASMKLLEKITKKE
jgi:hypothetical protein